jgi:hypothetical protein
MILNDFTEDDEQIECNDSWSEEDLQDLSAFSLSYAEHTENPELYPKS